MGDLSQFEDNYIGLDKLIRSGLNNSTNPMLWTNYSERFNQSVTEYKSSLKNDLQSSIDLLKVRLLNSTEILSSDLQKIDNSIRVLFDNIYSDIDGFTFLVLQDEEKIPAILTDAVSVFFSNYPLCVVNGATVNCSTPLDLENQIK